MLPQAFNGIIVLYTGYIFLFFAVFIIARAILREQETRQAEENLDESDRKDADGLLKFTRPFFTQYVVPLVRGREVWENKRILYRRKIIASGMRDILTPDEFISFKFFLVVFFPITLGLLQAFDFIDVSGITIALSGVGGWFYPDLWVNGKIKQRQKQIRRAIPFIIDLLALSTEAGLDFIGAIGRVVEKAAPSPLVDELEQVLREIRVGSSRSTALHEMAERIDMQEVSSFIAILVSAEEMGASIGKVLRQQSEQIRSERFVRAEKEGAAAQPKLIMLTAVLILPAVLLMIAAPFVLGFISGGPGP